MKGSHYAGVICRNDVDFERMLSGTGAWVLECLAYCLVQEGMWLYVGSWHDHGRLTVDLELVAQRTLQHGLLHEGSSAAAVHNLLLNRSRDEGCAGQHCGMLGLIYKTNALIIPGLTIGCLFLVS